MSQIKARQIEAEVTYKAIYEAAYEAMNASVLETDCGALCSHNCCRNDYEDPEDFGIYLLPYEYEHFLKETGMIKPSQMVWHDAKDRFMPHELKGLNYFYCDAEKDCLRNYRPIQCRAYPLEPHIENNELFLVVEKDQFHNCPLLKQAENWRKEYIKGMYDGWSLLIQIPDVKKLVLYDSDQRRREENYTLKLSQADCQLDSKNLTL